MGSISLAHSAQTVLPCRVSRPQYIQLLISGYTNPEKKSIIFISILIKEKLQYCLRVP